MKKHIEAYNKQGKIMTQLSKHFNSDEFKCKGTGCIAHHDLDMGLVFILEYLHCEISSLFGIPNHNVRIKITSGIRCHEHNKKVGGKEKSKHIYGHAADIKCYYRNWKRSNHGVLKWLKIKPQDIYDYLDYTFQNTLGLGVYKTFNHIDTRKIKARWIG